MSEHQLARIVLAAQVSTFDAQMWVLGEGIEKNKKINPLQEGM